MIPSGKREDVESMLERAEQFAAGLRSTLSQKAGVEALTILLLVFLQGPQIEAMHKKQKSTEKRDFSVLRFDARVSVLLRRLALLLRVRLSTVSALEELAIFRLEQETKRMVKQAEESDEAKRGKKWVRGLKIGAAATAAGSLLAVTGGLAAPALAAGLTGLGLGAAATLTTSATVAALLGAGGAGLGAYKMTRRTRGVRHFRFEPINDESNTPGEKDEDKLKGMTVYICISGYLRAPGPDLTPESKPPAPSTTSSATDQNQNTKSQKRKPGARAAAAFRNAQQSFRSSSSSLPQLQAPKSSAHTSPDFFAPWGAQPPHLFHTQLLDRYYAVFAPEKRKLVPKLVEHYEGQEEQFFDGLEMMYGVHPKRLCPPEGKRDYFQGEDSEIYRSLLEHGEKRLASILASNADSTSWEVSDASLMMLINQDRPWQTAIDLLDDHSNSPDPSAEQHEKTKEEMEEIVAELNDKFEQTNNQEFTSSKDDETALLEEIANVSLRRDISKEKRSLSFDSDAGLFRNKKDPEVFWWRESVARYGDQYTLVWEPTTLLKVGTCVENLIKEGAKKGALSALQFTALSAVVAAVILPVVITSFVSMLDDYWTMAVEAADEAGELLAEALMSDTHGNRPVVLIGYSVGGRVVASCLSTLAKIATGQDGDTNGEDETIANTNGLAQKIEKSTKLSNHERKRRLRAATIVRDAVIIGAPLDTNAKKWARRRSVVLGRLLNVYNSDDWVLALIYRYKSWSVVPLAGLQKVDAIPSPMYSPVENFNVKSIVPSHGEYHVKVQEILEHIGIGDVASEKFHEEYFVTGKAEA